MAFRVPAGVYTAAVTFLGCLDAIIVPQATTKTTTTLGPTTPCYRCTYTPSGPPTNPACAENLWQDKEFTFLDVPKPGMVDCPVSRCSVSLNYSKTYAPADASPTSKVSFTLGCLESGVAVSQCAGFTYTAAGSSSCFSCSAPACNLQFLTRFFRWFAETAATSDQAGRGPTKLPDFYATTTRRPYPDDGGADDEETTPPAADRAVALVSPVPLISVVLLMRRALETC
ncbi:uncharacterized protein LOC129602345 [Paramacrobiotus metropolitanus]|uniref:uncharacterized protein LOC129602345 n=1 Tax=Paramacrobiotus metropolitanus TaxID=2943436 RepID=UPI002445826A|nr:uncharacterized protein LOC129602345 [Paramacrobiotus metropolitanus]XP_055357424.1 uncharacterized protein LOC129602345 [Paramacrobiotus metropolitanus]XP_055357497.1 uncharacterized protein LOC129602345 [Paramacrobiotus metropolitanus]XP_055357571.1 uncharacterized protein LOC129602345 [Paramacrobiotus metropolitanus]XP_055357586.1 uncharacterized protein LOC129602345 [Paramacrobiotus metropolitanus]